MEDIQIFTSRRVNPPRSICSKSVVIHEQYLHSAATIIIDQLGQKGIDLVGGEKWWQWRGPMNDLGGEWIEMESDREERVQKGNQRCNRVMLYIHGGAFFFGSVDTHRYQLERHAKRLKGQVFAPQYRLAPQFPFPCALQDCFAAYLYLLSINEPNEIILAGDSAGGGLVLSMLCTIRDRGLPPPAGAVLISAWVDLAHSFSSVVDNAATDYIPSMGFRNKPSRAWPGLNEEEAYAIWQKIREKMAARNGQKMDDIKDEERPGALTISKADSLPIDIDGETMEIKRQIHFYASNRMIAHPLVSPVVQPSLGGLPPLYLLCGGGEMLRDEQIYIAHKAANPRIYPPADAILDEYDPNREILNKYGPTYVQLQVWDGLCHAAPTFTCIRSAKHMYNAISQFAAWALSRAQNSGIDFMSEPDKVYSVTAKMGSKRRSSKVGGGGEGKDGSGDNIGDKGDTQRPQSVGKAGDFLPPFHKHIIRQRIDEDGHVFRLDRSTILPVLRRPKSKICAINPDLAKKWLQMQEKLDSKFRKSKHRVHRQIIQELIQGYEKLEGEFPPPTALVARRPIPKSLPQRETLRNCGVLLWSRWPFGRSDPAKEAGTSRLIHGSGRTSTESESESDRISSGH